MTTRYTDFLAAYDAGRFKDTTSLSVKLVDATYKPDESHKIADVTGIILTATGVLTWKEFQSHGMEWIKKTLEDRAATYREAHPDKVTDGTSIEDVAAYVVYSGGLGVLCFCESEVSHG